MTMDDSPSACQVLGSLSSCPIEIRWQIYELVMLLDSQIFEFEFEGPKNLHVPVATLEALQNRRLPSIARVCREMREYAVRANSHIKVSFMCCVFGIDRVHQIMQDDEPIHYSLMQRLLEFKDVTAYFDPRRDLVSFKPHKWTRLPKDFPTVSYEQDRHGDVYCEYDPDAPNAPRWLTFAVSSMLVTAPRTEFEELVLAQWDKASSQHLERIENYEVGINDDILLHESITRLLDNNNNNNNNNDDDDDDDDDDEDDRQEQVHSLGRSYNPFFASAPDFNKGLVWHGRAQLEQWITQARAVVPQPNNSASSLMVAYETQLMLLEQRNQQKRHALARE